MRIVKKSEINVGRFTCDDSCYSIKESSFSHINVSIMPDSFTYLALQLEIGVGVFPEAREYEESSTSTVANLFARRADGGPSKRSCVRARSHGDKRQVTMKGGNPTLMKKKSAAQE